MGCADDEVRLSLEFVRAVGHFPGVEDAGVHDVLAVDGGHEGLPKIGVGVDESSRARGADSADTVDSVERGCAGRGHDAATEIERPVGSRFPDQRGPEGDAGKGIELREPGSVGGTGRGQSLVRGRIADSDLHADSWRRTRYQGLDG